MGINNQLEILYKKKLQRVEDLYHYDHEIDGPLLMYCWEDEYNRSEHKILFVGQECDEWIGYTSENYDELIEKYRNFKLSKNGNRTTFWQYVYYVNSILNPSLAEENNFLWTNVSKFCTWDGKSLDWQIHKDIIKNFDCLKEELLIVQPDVILFFSGPTYDDRIRIQFDEQLQFLQLVPEIPIRELARVSHPLLPKHSYRTYHPKSMQIHYKNQHLESILDFIKRDIEKED
jgi:hypothetical protein